jgi:hypothetical protein
VIGPFDFRILAHCSPTNTSALELARFHRAACASTTPSTTFLIIVEFWPTGAISSKVAMPPLYVGPARSPIAGEHGVDFFGQRGFFISLASENSSSSEL